MRHISPPTQNHLISPPTQHHLLQKNILVPISRNPMLQKMEVITGREVEIQGDLRPSVSEDITAKMEPTLEVTTEANLDAEYFPHLRTTTAARFKRTFSIL